MNAIDIARSLKQEADDLLFSGGYHALLQKHGEVIYTGSYSLDLMAWPDIDLELALDDRLEPVAPMCQLAFDLAKREDVVLVKLDKEIHQRLPSLPRGLYVGVKLKSRTRNRLWKLDIWALDEEQRDKNRRIMQRIAAALDDDKRRLILEMKQKLITPAGRTPPLSGHHLYEAIVFKELRDEEDIRTYLQDQGIVLAS